MDAFAGDDDWDGIGIRYRGREILVDFALVEILLTLITELYQAKLVENQHEVDLTLQELDKFAEILYRKVCESDPVAGN